MKSADLSAFKAPALFSLSLYAFFKIFSAVGPSIFNEAKGKKQVDHLYTRIRGVWYDLANFEHPGGPVALNLAKGRDSTAQQRSIQQRRVRTPAANERFATNKTAKRTKVAATSKTAAGQTVDEPARAAGEAAVAASRRQQRAGAGSKGGGANASGYVPVALKALQPGTPIVTRAASAR